MVAGGALFNAAYGAESGTTIQAIALLAFMYFLADVALFALGYMLLPRLLSLVIAWISLGLFCVLSTFSGASYLISQEYQQKNALVIDQKDYVAQLRSDLKTKPETMKGFGISNYNRLKREISAEQSRLNAMIEKVGGYVSGSAAIYAYLGKATGTEAEVISVVVRISWALTFVIGSLALGGMAGSSYSPSTLAGRTNGIVKSATALQDGNAQFSQAMIDYSNNRMLPDGASEPSAPVVSDAPVRSLGVTVHKQHTDYTREQIGAMSKADQYQIAKRAVLSGHKPSQRSVKDLGIGSNYSLEFLHKMKGEGIVEQSRKGFRLS
jgi:hypothetical protein